MKHLRARDLPGLVDRRGLILLDWRFLDSVLLTNILPHITISFFRSSANARRGLAASILCMSFFSSLFSTQC